MKTLAVILLMLVFIVGCPGQVIVPTANIQPVLDSLAVLKVKVALLESKAITVKAGSDYFPAQSWRRAVYIQGVTPLWHFTVTPKYASESPAIDYLVRMMKNDSLIVIRQVNGTSGLAFDYMGILP